MMMSWWRAWAEIVLSPCEGEFLVVRVTFRLFWENGLVPVVCGQGAGRLRTRAFVVERCVPLSPLPPGPVLFNSRPARAPREQRHPGRVPRNSASGCPTERRTPPPQASSAPSPPSVPTAGGLSLDLVVQFLRGLNVPSELLADIQNAVPPPARKKTAQQITKEQRCSQLRNKVDITKQQLAKLSKRAEALAKEHTEAAQKVVAKQAELAQLEVELEEARRLIMQPTRPSTPPPSQGLRGHSSPRVSKVASSGMAVDAELLLPSEGEEKVPKRLRVGATGEDAPSLQQVLDAKETFSAQDLGSFICSFQQRQISWRRKILRILSAKWKALLGGQGNYCASGGRERRSRLSTTSPNVSSKVKSSDPSFFF